ncbi:MAG: hypothetical protein ABMA13_22200 [Chthoniobacteraceae bacterium]
MIEFRPVNPERPLAVGQSGREITEVVAVDPPGIVCEESIFVNAVTTLGIPLVDFAEIHEEIEGRIVRKLVWRLELLAVETAVPRYTLAELRAKWTDAKWLTEHPAHELALIKAASDNLLRFAERARLQPWLWRFAKSSPGRKAAVFIPSTAGEEERAKWLAELAAA